MENKNAEDSQNLKKKALELVEAHALRKYESLPNPGTAEERHRAAMKYISDSSVIPWLPFQDTKDMELINSILKVVQRAIEIAAGVETFEVK